MIRVRIEMVPFGNEGNAHLLSEIRVVNAMTHPGRPLFGNYDVEVFHNDKIYEIEIRDHLRALGFWPLLSQVMDSMCELRSTAADDDNEIDRSIVGGVKGGDQEL